MESFTAAVQALAGGDPRDWSLPAVSAQLGRAGHLVERTATGRLETRPVTDDLRVDVIADPDVDDPHAAGAVYGVGLTPSGGNLGAAVAAAQQVLGPPPTVGGPGPWVRWPTPTTWWTLTRSAGTGIVRLFAEPADRAAQDEQRDMDFSTLAALPYLWRIDDESRLPPGTWLPTARAAKTLDVLAVQLTQVCAAVGEAVRMLPGHVPAVELVVRPRRGKDESVRCRMEAAGTAVLAGGTRTSHPTSELGAHAAAETVMAAIRSWGMDEPGKRLRELSVSDAGTLSVPGLGVPRGRG